MKRSDDVRYTYKSLSVPGGGFVTGFVFHPSHKDLLYARTDVGGIYRYDFNLNQWHFLSACFNEYERHLMQPLSIALDKENKNSLYAMCGSYGRNGGKAALLISADRGATFTEKPVPFQCNGNSPARSAAERLAYNNGKLFFGSQGDGLWCSDNHGDSWKKLPFEEENITFVYFLNDIMIVSCTGETNAVDNNRGHTLYVSYDYGNTYEKLKTPASLDDERCGHNGFVGVGIAAENDKVYITFSHSYKENMWGGWNDFACDNGGGFDGRLYRYKIADGKLQFSDDITPAKEDFHDDNPARKLPFGLGGADVSGDTIAVCSIGGHGDAVFISKDSGKTYNTIKSTDLERFDIDVPYLKPQYNGGRVPLHWMSCLRIDPFNPDFAVLNTGTGIFALKNLTGDSPRIATLCRGVEETVHMNIYGLPNGKNKVIDLVGDLGGFVFSKLDAPCENSFADKDGHRYITCLNADFLWNNPDVFIATARGNWTGHTKGGVIMTTDGGDSFTHIGYPAGISEKTDEAIERITRPNSNSGWAAITADGKGILWTLAYKFHELPCFSAVRYDIADKSFEKIRVYDTDGRDISESEHHIKLFADKVNGSRAYGFGEKGQLYTSNDGGKTFYRTAATGDFPECMMSGIDGWKNSEIRFLPTKEGVCYAALLNHGLWKLSFGEREVLAEQVSGNGDFVKTVGFGKNDVSDLPTLFISGTIMGEYGFWRSCDGGESWAKINGEAQMYGGIVSIDGDMAVKGRVYIATSGYGGLYGEECE
ncbi:MAG: hypothetical protein IJ385_02325 [Ruminiclostridium sp.]|nr:hypothetical protein [Ruminiclostridium sp.]